MPWRPVLLPQERAAHLSSTLKTLSWRAALAQGMDPGRPHHLCSRGNGVWGGSQEVKVQMGRVAGDAPHLKSRCRSSGETRQYERGHLSLCQKKSALGGEPNVPVVHPAQRGGSRVLSGPVGLSL